MNIHAAKGGGPLPIIIVLPFGARITSLPLSSSCLQAMALEQR